MMKFLDGIMPLPPMIKYHDDSERFGDREKKMNNELKAGDVVVLKSGGPEMTVFEIGEDDTATTVWFPDYNSPISYEFFRVSMLRKVDVDS